MHKTSKITKTIILILIALFIGFQWVCINQVRSLLEFSGNGERTSQPEKMNVIQKVVIALFGVKNPRPIISDTPESIHLEYEEIEIKTDDGELISAWLINSDNNDNVTILFHGFASSKSSQLEEARYLHSKGLTVLLVDFRGCGNSSGNKTTIGYYEANDVKSVYEWVKRRFPDSSIILFGQSMGAAAILRATAKYDIHPDGIIIESIFDNLRKTIENRFDAIGFPTFPSANLMIIWAKILYKINVNEHNPVDYATHIDCSILVMHGKQDSRAKVDEGLSVYEQIASRNKKWVVFDGLGHESLIKGATIEWRQVMGDYVNAYNEREKNKKPANKR